MTRVLWIAQRALIADPAAPTVAEGVELEATFGGFSMGRGVVESHDDDGVTLRLEADQ